MWAVLSDSDQRSEARRAAEHDEYLLSMSEGDKEIYRAVILFLAAIGKLEKVRGEGAPIRLTEVHRIFPDFGFLFGLPKSYLEVVDGRCRAVSVYFNRDEDYRGVMFIVPRSFYETWPERLDQHQMYKQIMFAALKAARVWLPHWDWDFDWEAL